MGLAQRFREQLKHKDIFEDKRTKKKTIQNKNNSGIIYELDIKTISEIKNYTTNVIKNSTSKGSKSIYKPTTTKDDLKIAIRAKILKTPCWDDYSIKTKTTMLEKYFDTKMKGQTYSKTEKSDFVNSILNNK